MSSNYLERMLRGTLAALTGAAVLALLATAASAQTYGFATLQPGTLNHTTASAIAKVLKEKAGLNVLVQPTAGDNVIVPMVGRGRGRHRHRQCHGSARRLDRRRQKDLRIIATAHALRTRRSSCARIPR